jgi:hypothetical protein
LKRGVRGPAILCVSVILALGCSGFGKSGPSSYRVEAEDKYDPSLDTVHDAPKKRPPSLPDGTLVQIFDPKTAAFDRIDDKGQLRRGKGDGSDQLVQVHPKGASKRNRMTAEGLDRLTAALAAADIVHQPAKIESEGAPEGAKLEWVAFTVPHSSGSSVTIEVKADRRDAATFGPLAELWTVLQEEAWGLPEEE